MRARHKKAMHTSRHSTARQRTLERLVAGAAHRPTHKSHWRGSQVRPTQPAAAHCKTSCVDQCLTLERLVVCARHSLHAKVLVVAAHGKGGGVAGDAQLGGHLMRGGMDMQFERGPGRQRAWESKGERKVPGVQLGRVGLWRRGMPSLAAACCACTPPGLIGEANCCAVTLDPAGALAQRT